MGLFFIIATVMGKILSQKIKIMVRNYEGELGSGSRD